MTRASTAGSLATAKRGRDNRIDIVRGIALATIFINHTRGNVYEGLTSRNFGFSDAAEVFVFLAGVAAAFAYWPLIERGEPGAAVRKSVHRAGKLYAAHVVSTVIAIAMFGWAAVTFGRPEFLKIINLGHVFADPATGLVGVVLLTHQLGYFNILPMYMVLLLALPFILIVARIDLRLMLGLSIVLWLVSGVFMLDLPNHPTPGGWFFNPLAWQVLFVAGIYAVLRARSGDPITCHPLLFWLACGYLAFAAVFVKFGWWGYFPSLNLPHTLWGFDKTYVGLCRLVHVLALAYVIAFSPIGRWLGHRGPENPLALMGRHALPVFCLGSILSMAGLITIDLTEASVARDTALIAAGLFLQMALARFLAWEAGTVARLWPVWRQATATVIDADKPSAGSSTARTA